jgi:hypothetical protein
MKVLTSHEWVAAMFDGYSNKPTNKIQLVRDINERPIIGTSILTDPDYDLSIPIKSPDGEVRALGKWFWEIDYEPKLEEEFI